MSGQDQNKQQPPADDRDKRRARWPWVVGIVVLVAFIGTVLALIFTPNADVWTDDAYVQVHYASIAPRIAGQVSQVSVDDNAIAAVSSELVQLDDRDQQTSLKLAEAQLARDQAQLRNTLANVDRQPSVIQQQDAQIRVIEAQMILSRANLRRYTNLAATGAGSQQDRQQAESTLAEQQAQLDAAKAATDAARHQLDILRAQADAARETLRADAAQIAQAKLTLSYTRILAPVAGMVAQRSVQVGDYVGPGTTLMTLVPLDALYIIANYREVALRHVLPGQHVRIHVDAYNIDLDGVVQGIAPSSGAIYSPIPPNNATGNFTKIVQRLPVKILVSPNQPLARLLRAGYSVETTIHTGLTDVVAAQAQTPNLVTVH